MRLLKEKGGEDKSNELDHGMLPSLAVNQI